jgi:5-formyltetrahydrofolate cyclo-ligase
MNTDDVDASDDAQTAAKSALRVEIKKALAAINNTERESSSLAACARLKKQDLWHNAQSILFYAPLAKELDLWPLLLEALAAGRTVALPRFSPESGRYIACSIKDTAKDLKPGKFGIREPTDACPEINLKRLDLALVPGVAFDMGGHRLGRGGGYYDRLLAMFGGPACGVAFDRQIVERVPAGPHDVQLNCILTPTRWHLVQGRRL